MRKIAIEKKVIQRPDASRVERTGSHVYIFGCRNAIDATSADGTGHIGVKPILKSFAIVRSGPNCMHLSTLNSSHKVFQARFSCVESLGFVSRRYGGTVVG